MFMFLPRHQNKIRSPEFGPEENRIIGALRLKKFLKNHFVPILLPLIRISHKLSQVEEPERDDAVFLGYYLKCLLRFKHLDTGIDI